MTKYKRAQSIRTITVMNFVSEIGIYQRFDDDSKISSGLRLALDRNNPAWSKFPNVRGKKYDPCVGGNSPIFYVRTVHVYMHMYVHV